MVELERLSLDAARRQHSRPSHAHTDAHTNTYPDTYSLPSYRHAAPCLAYQRWSRLLGSCVPRLDVSAAGRRQPIHGLGGRLVVGHRQHLQPAADDVHDDLAVWHA